ncbi:hypothetical protein BH09PSE2_BH09PSE2_19390 [soil metagenome]
MSALYSRIDRDAGTTLPSPVRVALGLRPGDSLAYEVGSDGVVVIRRAPPLDHDHLHALRSTLTEWQTPEDAAAFDAL